MKMPKISREELERLRTLFLARRKNKDNYRIVANGLGLPSLSNYREFWDVVTTHLSVQRTRIALAEKDIAIGSKVECGSRRATIVKIGDFDEEVSLHPFGGCPVIIKFDDSGKIKRCGGTTVDSFRKVD